LEHSDGAIVTVADVVVVVVPTIAVGAKIRKL
jgi:hypothetical protein